ncbi:MAG: DNA adenine methylase, partial [Cellulomonadaceae bacterium]|nr:DNA adenine methylase [Cellulomonadaceae bacterium]
RLTCTDFANFDSRWLPSESLVYCDPPYLITCAPYCENGRWNTKNEIQLYEFLDGLNDSNVRFALSNAVSSKGRKNELLQRWARKYRTVPLDYHYGNSNYHTKDKTKSTQEVLIVNY